MIFSKIYNLILRFYNPVKWAKNIGVKIGNNVQLGRSTNFSSEPYLIEICDNVQITRNVSFFTHGGSHVARQTINDFDVFGKIKIESNVYIGACTLIMPGVTIGEGSLVAAGSVVTKSVRPGVIVGGNPAREIATIKNYIEKNKAYNVHTAGLSEKKKRVYLLNINHDNFIKK